MSSIANNLCIPLFHQQGVSCSLEALLDLTAEADEKLPTGHSCTQAFLWNRLMWLEGSQQHLHILLSLEDGF